MQDHNIFGSKIYSESIYLGLNFIFHTQTPVHVHKYSKYTPGMPPVPSVFSWPLHFQIHFDVPEKRAIFF